MEGIENEPEVGNFAIEEEEDDDEEQESGARYRYFRTGNINGMDFFLPEEICFSRNSSLASVSYDSGYSIFGSSYVSSINSPSFSEDDGEHEFDYKSDAHGKRKHANEYGDDPSQKHSANDKIAKGNQNGVFISRIQQVKEVADALTQTENDTCEDNYGASSSNNSLNTTVTSFKNAGRYGTTSQAHKNSTNTNHTRYSNNNYSYRPRPQLRTFGAFIKDTVLETVKKDKVSRMHANVQDNLYMHERSRINYRNGNEEADAAEYRDLRSQSRAESTLQASNRQLNTRNHNQYYRNQRSNPNPNPTWQSSGNINNASSSAVAAASNNNSYTGNNNNKIRKRAKNRQKITQIPTTLQVPQTQRQLQPLSAESSQEMIQQQEEQQPQQQQQNLQMCSIANHEADFQRCESVIAYPTSFVVPPPIIHSPKLHIPQQQQSQQQEPQQSQQPQQPQQSQQQLPETLFFPFLNGNIVHRDISHTNGNSYRIQSMFPCSSTGYQYSLPDNSFNLQAARLAAPWRYERHNVIQPVNANYDYISNIRQYPVSTTSMARPVSATTPPYNERYRAEPLTDYSNKKNISCNCAEDCSKIITISYYLRRYGGMEVKSAPIDLTNDKLSQAVWAKFIDAQQKDATFVRKVRLWEALLMKVRKAPNRFGLYLVGSSLSGFSIDGSDVDLCLTSSNLRCRQHCYEQNILNQMTTILKENARFVEFNLINARVPILRFRDLESNLEVDLNYNSDVGIKNTHLLFLYARIDWRVRPLVVVFKLWARHHDINSARGKTMSSYALALMVIHFLQASCKPPVLPCLQRDCKIDFEQRNFRCEPFESKLPAHFTAAKNTKTLGTLFSELLKYYSDFPFGHYALSVRLGCLIPRLESTTLARNFEWRQLNVEEPFELTNAAHSVFDINIFNHVKDLIRESADIIKKTGDLSAIFYRTV